jgi:ribosomal protein S27E
MEITPTRRITCKECATEKGRIQFLPCGEHHLIIPAEMCGHEHNSVIFIHNGTGVSCHDCGTITTLEIGE